MEHISETNGDENVNQTHKTSLEEQLNELNARLIRISLGCAGSCGHNCFTCQKRLNKPETK